ncbi:hypothetical protein NKOR_04465 [Candidatus Nitrosopumilus koreensis AR1]|uniref:DUF371 domain-containing protein n=1 Tax=Candidatus Nitrosopumilus koreensis AR1 TaxID=1229908 RepID=K0B8H8_9ARCH|nr:MULTISPECIES: DUF371 domain-containing protein [Nitrosopumilus]AFS80781.1 hypothetical protein NKOR_04465 [Candidatus Nitrosopumilus koreensis AR1]
MRFEIKFSGHENIRSNHQKTIEITKESHLTPQGDCIIGVGANYACADLPQDLKDKLKQSDSNITFSIDVGKYSFTVHGKGHPDLTLTHTEDIVIRKSDFVCPRTLSVKCDKASDLLPREMVSLLQDPKTKGTFTITVD